MSDVQFAFDPEIVPLENGGFSLYYRNSADGITEWFNVTLEEVEALAVPGVVTPLPEGRITGQTTIAVAPGLLNMSSIGPVNLTSTGSVVRLDDPLSIVERMAGAEDGSLEAEDVFEARSAGALADNFDFDLPRLTDEDGPRSDVLAAKLSTLAAPV